jgi:hypothetical protein
MLNRRRLLQSAALLPAAAALPRPARAAGADLKYIFVFNNGGWDPTRVLADGLSHRNVDSESTADRATAGGITYVSDPSRPSVDAFMQAWHQDMLLVSGLQVRSIAHEICTLIALTGSTSGRVPDWGTLIAASTAERYTLPHLVLGGPSFPGEEGTSVARTGLNGQLEALLSGDILNWGTEVQPLSPAARGILDSYLSRRATGARSGAHSAQAAALLATWESSHSRAVGLQDYRYVMDFTTTGDLAEQAAVGVDALSVGLSRVVSMGYPGPFVGLGWDTHANNDSDQAALWEGLFSGLGQLMQLLEQTPGTTTASLREETVVVVLSEMGRTPQLNATLGKDHWPYTSCMLLGPGLTTDRVIGGFDQGWNGELVDPATAELDEGGHVLSVESLGAALLELADIDPAEHVSGAEVLRGVLA